jgi:hypothetical protein
MVKSAAILFGIVFLALGILGFVSAATQIKDGMPMLLGLFHVNAAHNVVHLASGIVFLLGGMAGAGPSRALFKIFGIVYAIVAVWGFVAGNGNTLFVVSNNSADTWLHVVLALAMLYLGFGARDTATA